MQRASLIAVIALGALGTVTVLCQPMPPLHRSPLRLGG